MQKRLLAFFLMCSLLCAMMPNAFAAEQEIQTRSGVSITGLYGETISDEIDIISVKDIPKDADVIHAVDESDKVFSSRSNASLQSADAVFSRQLRSNTASDAMQSQMTGTTSNFTTYGAQLSQVCFAIGGQYVDVGSQIKQLYDNAKAELSRGTASAYFTGNESAMYNRSVSFTLSGVSSRVYRMVAQQMVWLAYLSLDYDCPEMFYSNGYCKAGVDINGSGIRATMIPLYTQGFTTLGERTAYKAELDQKVAELTAQAAQYSKAYDKLKFFTQWLCDNNVYNDDAASTPDYSNDISGAPWSSVSGILSSSDSSVAAPVCEGYSRALQLLCKQAGITCTVVTSGSGVHMWNNVRYGSGWTGIDATFLDSSGEWNDYFCTLTNNMDFAHFLDDENFADWADYPELYTVESSNVLPFYDALTWQREAVQYMYDNNYMQGVSCVDFEVYSKLTRAQFVRILYNRAGNPAAASTASLSDVQEGKWYTDACNWAVEQGIIQGYPNGSFGINNSITRQEIAVILYRMYHGSVPEQGWSGRVNSFADGQSISTWAWDAMNWMADNYIYNGDNYQRVLPRNAATRGEAAKLLMSVWTNIG